MKILGLDVATPADGLPADAPRGKRAEQILAAEQLAEIRYLRRTMTDWTEQYAGRITNHTLDVFTGTFDATGIIARTYHVAAGSIEVTNLSTAVGAVTTNTQASNVFAGAAAGSVSLPVGASITGFYLDFQAPASAVNGDVTVTNVAGGTMTFRIVLQAANGNVFVPFPNPLPAASSGVAPTVNVPAIATGPAYSITVTGQTTVAATPAHSMTVSTAGPASGVPTGGVGVFVVPAGASHTIALASRQVTIYGTQGDQVSFQVFTTGVQPSTV